MNEIELEVLNHLVAAWNAYVRLGDGPEDATEFKTVIHAAQFQMLARPTIRELVAKRKAEAAQAEQPEQESF